MFTVYGEAGLWWTRRWLALQFLYADTVSLLRKTLVFLCWMSCNGEWFLLLNHSPLQMTPGGFPLTLLPWIQLKTISARSSSCPVHSTHTSYMWHSCIKIDCAFLSSLKHPTSTLQAIWNVKKRLYRMPRIVGLKRWQLPNSEGWQSPNWQLPSSQASLLSLKRDCIWKTPLPLVISRFFLHDFS